MANSYFLCSTHDSSHCMNVSFSPHLDCMKSTEPCLGIHGTRMPHSKEAPYKMAWHLPITYAILP